MILYHLKIAHRHIRKSKLYALINITTLSVGLVSFLLIALFTYDELRFDRHHSNASHIYRIVQRVDDVTAHHFANVPGLLAPTLQAEFPDKILKTTRLWNYWSLGFNVRHEDRLFKEINLAFVDSSYFHIFDHKFLRGDAQNPLAAPNSVVLTESSARKYFADADPIGKALRINDSYELYVTAVIQDMPRQSHFRFDFLASFSTLQSMAWQHEINSWREGFCHTYLLAESATTREDIEVVLRTFFEKHHPDGFDHRTFIAQPITDIHLNSLCEDELTPGGSRSHLFVLISIAAFILVLAVLNSINLSLTYFNSRAREMSVRKILGSKRRQIVTQFTVESALIGFAAIAVSFAIIDIVLPLFTGVFGNRLSLSHFNLIFVVTIAGALWFSLTMCIGLVPGLSVSSDKIHRLWHRQIGWRPGEGYRQKSFVIFQMAIASVLLLGALLIHSQMNYVQSFDTKIKHDRIVILPVNQTPISAEHYASFTETLMSRPGFVSATGMRCIAGYEHIKEPFTFLNKEHPSEHLLPFLLTRRNFLKTFDIGLIAGRDFSPNFSTDASRAVIINRTLARMLAEDIDDAIGQRLKHPGWGELEIIGVVEDFHFESLHTTVKPLVLKMIWPHRQHALTDYLAVRLTGQEIHTSLRTMEKIWRELAPQFPFDYYFLDDKLDTFYSRDLQLGRLVIFFTIIALGIAAFGLFGFVSFIAERRTKEIAIRKILGASSRRLFRMLSSEFLILVILANAVAWPIAYLLINRWLQNFSYHMPLPLWVFPATILFTLFLSMLTILYHILKSAVAEPVQFLRYE